MKDKPIKGGTRSLCIVFFLVIKESFFNQGYKYIVIGRREANHTRKC